MPLVGVVTSYPAISSKLNPGFSRVRIAQSALVFCVLFCGSLIVFLTFHVAITLLVLLRITASNYPGIFNLFCGDSIASERKKSLFFYFVSKGIVKGSTPMKGRAVPSLIFVSKDM
jgi:hypothetical protein